MSVTQITAIKVTENEQSVLRAILTNYFSENNGGIPDVFIARDFVWSSSLDDAAEEPLVTGKALSGVCGSLAVKGLVETTGSGKESAIALTKAGYDLAISGGAVE